ncbi:hypothetical protein LCGC14_0552250 [marine sediment metagenome]|uniref:Uncharacterized protein n=1 Tax=marine sediment metagenome TaxID=412755 RepID=A0A0F9S843_9ZZZZ
MNAERAKLVKEVKEALLQKYDVYTVSCSRDMAHHFGRWLGELRDAVEQLDAEAKTADDAFGDYIHKCMDCTDKSIKRDKQLIAERDGLRETVEKMREALVEVRKFLGHAQDACANHVARGNHDLAAMAVFSKAYDYAAKVDAALKPVDGGGET